MWFKDWNGYPKNRIQRTYDDEKKIIRIFEQEDNGYGRWNDEYKTVEYYGFREFIPEDSVATLLEGIPPDGVSLGPNPVQYLLFITFPPSASAEGRLQIVDFQGRLVEVIRIPMNTWQVDWQPSPTLKNGLYIYRLIMGEKVGAGKVLLRR